MGIRYLVGRIGEKILTVFSLAKSLSLPWFRVNDVNVGLEEASDTHQWSVISQNPEGDCLYKCNLCGAYLKRHPSGSWDLRMARYSCAEIEVLTVMEE